MAIMPPQQFKDIDLSKLDFGKLGSLNLIVTQFQGALLPYDFVNELRDLWETYERFTLIVGGLDRAAVIHADCFGL